MTDTSQQAEERSREAVEEPTGVRPLPWLLLVGGAIGLVAAFVLLVEKVKILEDPSYVPSCSINPVLSCGSVMKTDQASVFGFPNPMIGLIAFTALVVTGLVLLAGTRLPRWYWLGLQAGVTLGAVFVGWLVFQSLYRIHALCPYCMVVWAVVVPLFWYVTLHNLRTRVLPAPAALVGVLADFHALVLGLLYLLVIGLVLHRFWYYWQTLL